MKQIIVGLDGSEPSLKAAAAAAELAALTDSSLSLVFVRTPISSWSTAPDLYPKLKRELRDEADLILVRAAEAVKGKAPRVESHYIEAAHVAEALAELAAAKDVYMVVVGSRGLGAVKRMFLGSVTDRLAHISPKPVLIIH